MQTSTPYFPTSYAPAGDLIAAALQSFLPPDKVGVAAWAAEHRYLDNQGGGYVGRWDEQKAPYLTGIMDALTSPNHTTIAAVGPAQVGKNAIAENWLGQQIDSDPANLLWFMQTNDAIESYVKKIINPLIESHGRLLRKRGTDRTDDSLHFKRFTGMSAEFLAATKSNLVNKAAPRIIADEFDAYDLDGDPKTLLDFRRSTFGLESKLYASSHPDLATSLKESGWKRGVMAIYRESDRRVWWWQCPQCGCFCSPNPSASLYMPLEYNADAPIDEILENTHLLCPHHGCLIPDSDRRVMNLTGKWVGLGQHIDPITGDVTGHLLPRDAAGFWIVGAMSPFVRNGIGGLAATRVQAERDAELDPIEGEKTRRDVIVKGWGFCYDPPATEGTIDATTLADRADPGLTLGMVPSFVRFITAGIDNQGNRFELLFRGWGEHRESCIIDHRVIRAINGSPVEPTISASDWDYVLDQAQDAEFPLADGSGRVMRVRAVGYDTSGEPGVTAQAYAAWLRQRLLRRARMLGRVNFRDAWNLVPLKGASTRDAKSLTVTYPDSARQDRKVRARGEIPLGTFNPNIFKDALAGQFRQGAPGPGYVHIPAALRAEAPPHPFFEQLVSERRKPNGTWEKIATRNESLDLMVMCAVVAHLHAPTRFDWTRPPSWARPWDQNPLVGPPAASQPVSPIATAMPAAGRPAQPPAAQAPPRQAPQGMSHTAVLPNASPPSRLGFAARVAALGERRARP